MSARRQIQRERFKAMTFSAWRLALINKPSDYEETCELKSYIPQIQSRKDLSDALYFAFCHQYMLDRRTSPWEVDNWNKEQLDILMIDNKNITSLYYVSTNVETPSYNSWEICCKIMHNSKEYFVHMKAICEYTLDCEGGGCISLSECPQFFLNKIIPSVKMANSVYEILLKEGYCVEQPDSFSKVHPKLWRNVPTLSHLCYMAIYKEKEVLHEYRKQLPTIISESVTKYIIEKEWI